MSTFHNRTRQSASIPRRLLREGKPHLIPLYYLVRTSELAREGIEHSGSYSFADHIYRNRPRGRFGVGWVLDAVLLRLKSAQSLRARYTYAKVEMLPVVLERHACGLQTHVLAVPCGLAREFFNLADYLGLHAPDALTSTHFHGLDLDGGLISKLRHRSEEGGYPFIFHVGDALSREPYTRTFDIILSTGLTEFLGEEEVLRFYRLVWDHLAPGGRFITSGLDRHALSDYLLRNLGELHTHYRTEGQLRTLALRAGFHDVTTYQNSHRLQTMLIGIRN